MAPSNIRAILPILTLSVLTWSCGGQPAAEQDVPTITLVATGNVNNEVGPCGWPANPLGGLARKATALAHLQNEGHPLLLVDGGDLLFSKPKLGERALASEMIRARTLIEGYNTLGTDAMTIGESDLAAGLPFLRSMAEVASFPIVSANLVDEEGEPIFAPYAMVNRGGMKVAVIGASSVMVPGDGYRFTDPLTALKTHAAEVREEADLVVLLFHGSKVDQKRIDDAGLPIDVVLHSHLGGTAQADRSNRVPVALLGSEGKRLTALTVALKKVGEPVLDLSDIQRTITFVGRGIERLSRNQRKGVPLEEIYADNPQVLKRLALLRDRESLARAELAKATNTLIGRRIPLDRSIADDPKLLSMVNETLEAVEDLERSGSSGGS